MFLFKRGNNEGDKKNVVKGPLLRRRNGKRMSGDWIADDMGKERSEDETHFVVQICSTVQTSRLRPITFFDFN